MADRTLLMVGTRKGLWIGTSDEARAEWEFTGPHFDMEEVYSCLVDTRGDVPRLLAGASSSWLGPQVWRSDDLGASWQETPNGAVRFPEGTGRQGRAGLAAGAGRRARRSCTPAPSRPPCGGRPTGARPSRSSRRCGTTRTGPSGAPASAARRSTPCCRTPPTRRR